MSDTKNARLEIRLPPAMRDAVLNAAAEDGLDKSKWCRRVFATVLGTNGDALDATPGGQGSGDTPSVSSPRGSGSAKETVPTEHSASRRAHASTERADAEAKPKRITHPPRRADVGPKPVSATKPRPKAGKGKKG